MNPVRALACLLVGGILAMLAPAPAGAQASAARPIIVVGNTPTDPQLFAWLDDSARKALADDIAQHESGALLAFVFVGAPGGTWVAKLAAKPINLVSIEDMARMALQECEFIRHMPCFIVSINGNDARDAAGNLPVQPRLLDDPPAKFDAARIPFLSNEYQAQAAGYANATGQRAFVLSATGSWLWRTGKTAFDAIATAYGDCQKLNPNEPCLLYAVNSRVVFVPGDN